MKKESAIFRLQGIDNYLKRQNDYSERNHDAIMIAIEALKERPHGEWIPITYRPMDEEEYEWFRSEFGEIPIENRKMFSCQMPGDGQEILVCTKCGQVYVDIFEIYEYAYGLESNGDWNGITAWMPLPEPYKKEGDAL